MEWKIRVYRVLVVSASAEFRRSVTALLPSSRFAPIAYASNVSAAKRAVSERDFDFVIVHTPLPDDVGLRFAFDLAGKKNTVTLLILPPDLYENAAGQAEEQGVFVLSKPLSKPLVLTAISWMTSAREQLRKAEQKTQSVEEKMEEIRLINRAKWKLIGEKNLTEAEAHRYIEKLAMDRCVTRRAIAQEILSD
ncbi:MAG: response regulator [Clostridia bacterium]|nr:response regulator [Clostridia bacterium]